MHHVEEDHDGIAVYRHTDVAVPRGQDGIEFGRDGSFTDWLTGRDGAGEQVPGHWQDAGDGRLEVHTDRGEDLVFEVVQVAPDRLELRRSPS